MPRNARRKVPHVPLHIVQRGVDRCPTFRREDDYSLYLGLLNELAPRFACSVHAYVLMTNHVHILLTAETASGPSTLMQHLGQRYVQHFNRRHQRTGPLWESRFRSNPVDRGIYLFRCHRYIELNPVRAGMAMQPWEYAWSSYRFNAGLDPSIALSPHPEYLSLGSTQEERATNYRSFFHDPPTESDLAEIRLAINSGSAFGSVEFLRDLELRLSRGARALARGRPKRDDRAVPSGGKRALSPV
jgi:putative transposase